ncbi:MAG: hypothetical protein C0617_04530 [Desulfuromonas sp.]|uniref:type IV pilin protein n=1 Tax=Desulfuromonas sp. TaxID=892 RepID=UPI000CBD7629|nr:prepilin-type N-terminal cleavage/methylation domain-containing protein [Desulfuromonas sp.]PLX85344.1 MAG: hypothetical protein C0617_04530 [Desulfuromonas sp.]
MRPTRNRQRGFTLLELLIVVAIIGILASIAIPTFRTYREKAFIAGAIIEGRSIYNAFISFYLDEGWYPMKVSAPAFDLNTFSPLDYNGTIFERLVGNKADAFDSPDDMGTNEEFWLRMTLSKVPDVQLVVAQSDDLDIDPGVWLDGVYIYRNNKRIDVR